MQYDNPIRPVEPKARAPRPSEEGTWERTPETWSAMLWHKDAPEGRTFTYEVDADGGREGPTMQELADQGWVDDPAKIGISENGEAGRARSEEVHSLFRQGRLPSIESTAVSLETEMAREYASKQEALIETQAGEIERLKARLAAQEAMRAKRSVAERHAERAAHEEHDDEDAKKQAGRALDAGAAAKRSPRGRKQAA